MCIGNFHWYLVYSHLSEIKCSIYLQHLESYEKDIVKAHLGKWAVEI